MVESPILHNVPPAAQRGVRLVSVEREGGHGGHGGWRGKVLTSSLRLSPRQGSSLGLKPTWWTCMVSLDVSLWVCYGHGCSI